MVTPTLVERCPIAGWEETSCCWPRVQVAARLAKSCCLPTQLARSQSVGCQPKTAPSTKRMFLPPPTCLAVSLSTICAGGCLGSSNQNKSTGCHVISDELTERQHQTALQQTRVSEVASALHCTCVHTIVDLTAQEASAFARIHL